MDFEPFETSDLLAFYAATFCEEEIESISLENLLYLLQGVA